jgi:hypothetical protein
MVHAHVPDNRWNIVHALVVGHNDEGSICWKLLLVSESIPGSQNIRAPHDEPIEDGDTFFVSIISNQIETQPLYGMKNDQYQTKQQEKEDGQRIG